MGKSRITNYLRVLETLILQTNSCEATICNPHFVVQTTLFVRCVHSLQYTGAPSNLAWRSPVWSGSSHLRNPVWSGSSHLEKSGSVRVFASDKPSPIWDLSSDEFSQVGNIVSEYILFCKLVLISFHVCMVDFYHAKMAYE